MVASYVGDNHKHWDKYLPEFRFALNSAVHEFTGVTPAELNLSLNQSTYRCHQGYCLQMNNLRRRLMSDMKDYVVEK